LGTFCPFLWALLLECHSVPSAMPASWLSPKTSRFLCPQLCYVMCTSYLLSSHSV
jgi:hypothetical protein